MSTHNSFQHYIILLEFYHGLIISLYFISQPPPFATLTLQKVDQYAAPFTVTHYHFTSWPDHGVPLQTTSMLELLREVRKSHNRGKGVPLLVHCSAGVGRTGTFVALDILLDTLRSKGTISVFDVVAGMRKKRMLMVQTEVSSLCKYVKSKLSSSILLFFPFLLSCQLLPSHSLCLTLTTPPLLLFLLPFFLGPVHVHS